MVVTWRSQRRLQKREFSAWQELRITAMEFDLLQLHTVISSTHEKLSFPCCSPGSSEFAGRNSTQPLHTITLGSLYSLTFSCFSPLRSVLGSHDSLQALIKHLRHSGPRMQPLMPRPGLRILSLPLLAEVGAHELRGEEQRPVPRHEGEVGIRALVADEVGFAGLLEVAVDDADDATDPACRSEL